MLIINENKFNLRWTIAKYIYAIVPIIIGADKFFFYIVNWNIYVSSLATSIISITHLIPIIGIIEIFAGLIIFKYPRFGAYLVAAWISVIIINLFLIGNMYDIILRDVAIVFGYIVFAWLTEIKETAKNEQPTHHFNNL